MRHKVNEQTERKGPLGSSIRFGIVKAIELNGSTPTGRIQVRFPDRDNMVSHWLHVIVQHTKENQRLYTPDIDEQVACVMDELDEDGVVLGAIYSSVDPPKPGQTVDDDSIHYQDGAIIGYNRNTHTEVVTLPSAGFITVTTPLGTILIENEAGTLTVECLVGTVNIKATGGTVNITALTILIEAVGVLNLTAASAVISIPGGTTWVGNLDITGIVTIV